jgi:NAD(P)-dependent dehydrogenase (short-subunit alcohol dehydrogenase family)
MQDSPAASFERTPTALKFRKMRVFAGPPAAASTAGAYLLAVSGSCGVDAQAVAQTAITRKQAKETRMSNKGKVALITGGGTGIGRSAALALQADGWDVAVTGRRKEELDKTCAMAAKEGGKIVAFVADVGKEPEVKKLFADVVKTFGRLDFLFNNAGMGAPAVPMEDLPFATWQQVVDVNLTGSFLCAQEAIRQYKKQSPQGGRIVNNGSISAHAPRPMSVAYTATKHAITGLTKCIALDGRPFNIACGQLDVGNADTNMGGRMKAGVPQPRGDIMPEPVMHVDHCGSAIRYMASLPLDANVLTLTIKATNMPFEGRG